MNRFMITLQVILIGMQMPAQSSLEVVGLCIAAPDPEGVSDFIHFIEEELAPQGINTLILRVDYKYAYQSHPELRDQKTLSKADVKALVATCQKLGIQLIPQVNLLGHQSWSSTLGNLLKVYPQFDETPEIAIPKDYVWPNEDGLYCKSYCPLHPDVHSVVFDIVDEIVEVFESGAFHAGMDEVFYIAEDQCPRCSGKDPAALFAGEVNKIQDHLSKREVDLWIWGDRMIEGDTTGIGMWEASTNHTYPSINLISKDVVICDWHYEVAHPTSLYFARKGYDVISCSWRNAAVAERQVKMMYHNRQRHEDPPGDRFKGVMHTVWSSAEVFIEQYREAEHSIDTSSQSQINCFTTIVKTVASLKPKDNR